MKKLLTIIEDGVEYLIHGKYMDVTQARNFLETIGSSPESLTDKEGNSIPFRTENTLEAREHQQYFRGLDVVYKNSDFYITGSFYTQKITPTRYESLPDESQPVTHRHPKERHSIRTKL